MRRGSLRAALAALVAAAACIVVSPHANAARTAGPVERFVARATSVEDPKEATSPIDIMIERWSTEKEFEALSAALTQHGPDTLLPTLQTTWQRAGIVMTPGIMGAGSRARLRRNQNLMFARDIKTPKGRQVIVAADRHLPLGEKPAAVREIEYEFTLIAIRFGLDGKGIGKIATPGQVVYNKQTKVLEIGKYSELPVRLTEVRSEKP
jgi:hypothetical protein